MKDIKNLKNLLINNMRMRYSHILYLFDAETINDCENIFNTI